VSHTGLEQVNSQTIKDEAIADIKAKFNIDVACFPCGLKFLEVRAIARNWLNFLIIMGITDGRIDPIDENKLVLITIIPHIGIWAGKKFNRDNTKHDSLQTKTYKYSIFVEAE
jgi:hypothetical protein